MVGTYDEKGPFKHIAALASRMFNVPIALVNLVEKHYVHTLSDVGLAEITAVSRGTSLCSLAILQDEVMVIENALHDPCLLSNPLVTGEFGLKFYAGAPLKTSDGFNIGAVCIVDKTPREFSASDQKMLESLAAVVISEIEQGRHDSDVGSESTTIEDRSLPVNQ